MEKSKLWMMIIIVLLVVMCVAFGVGFFMLSNTIKSLQFESGETSQQDLLVPQVAQKDIEMFLVANQNEPIKSVLVPSPGHERPMSSLSLTLGLNSTDKECEKLKELLTSQLSVITSLIDDILRTKTFEDISTSNRNSKEALEFEILTALQEKFETNIIVAVYTNIITDPR